MSRSFCHLHVHSHFSLLDGVAKVPALVQAAKSNGQKALALTDHGNMFGAIEFYRECKKEGIKPIIGLEAYVTSLSRFEKRRDDHGSNYYHLVLLAQNAEGYQNLIKLSSQAYIDGFYYKPRIDHELLEMHSAGLIATSACLAGEVNRPLIHGELDRAREAALRYQKIFGKDRFFLEIQDHGMPEQRRVLEQVPGLAKELGIPLVATNDIHYLRQSDARAQEVHICISTGSTMEDDERLRFDNDCFHFRSTDEMYRALGDWPEALANTDEIAAMCDLQLEEGRSHLPIYRPGGTAQQQQENKTPDVVEEENRAQFRRLVEEGFARNYPQPTEEHRERLEYEIDVIERMGFVSYFLITWDFINYSRQIGVPVGPGRGSAVGSMVSYCLGITTLDPVRYDLIFERFLNSDRISMPDIDIDFCVVGRDKVIDYVRQKYGNDRVCQIITFGTMAAKAVIKDVGRALNIPLKEVEGIAKKIPDTLGIKLQEAIDSEPELEALTRDPRYQELFEAALRLEGLNRHCSTHAAGVVVCDQPLTDVVPLYRNGEDITTQFPMEILESLGLLKLDFLGLKTLTILDRAAKIVREETGIELDLETLPLDDVPTYELLAAGDTKGIFQLESSGMRELLRRMRPDRFDDLIAVLALYRPGPLGSGMDKVFCERKHGREAIDYPDPALEPILGDSFGVILYQEQVMRIAHDMAGFTMNEADSLRKAMGKKKPEIIAKFKQQFLDGSTRTGIDRKAAEQIFEQIEHFAKYGFNKSHSTAYAVISYRTAYLKANHPAAFLAGVLSCEIANVEKMVEYLAESKRLGIAVRPPSINYSGHNFTVRGGEIHYGLVAVKGVGEKAVEEVLREREANGPYESLFDFTSRVDLKAVNKTTVEQLIRCGAFDEIGPSRSRMVAVVKDAMDRGNRIQAERRAGQLSLFGESTGTAPLLDEIYPEVAEYSELERLAGEKDSLGFYMSGHPLDKFEHDLAHWRTHTIAEIASAGDQREVVLGVMISKIRTRQTKRGDIMAFLEVEDSSGGTEIVVFPKTYAEEKEQMTEDAIVLIQGTTEEREESVQVRADKVLPLADAFERLGRRLGVTFDTRETDENELFRLKDILHRHRGDVPVSLIFDSGSGARWVVRSNPELSVRPTATMLEELKGLVGPARIRVERN
ncbi:MAG: DNA polymerase III subunit alpha [Planctomycetes bacterium]|nr:DNA polymerase III subunit alpha [Planctomycetota bacterium]